MIYVLAYIGLLVTTIAFFVLGYIGFCWLLSKAGLSK